jgi:Tfp pilus assembly protein PilV
LVAVVIVAVAVTSLIIATRTKRNRQSSVARVEFP